jgi:hypothetical protein
MISMPTKFLFLEVKDKGPVRAALPSRAGCDRRAAPVAYPVMPLCRADDRQPASRQPKPSDLKLPPKGRHVPNR